MSGIVVLISGRGSNLRAIVEAGLPVRAVISDRRDAAGLAIAAEHRIAVDVLERRDFADRDSFDAALRALIDPHDPDVVALAGFMRILGTAFVDQYAGRLVNIHPSLLPGFPGLHTHERALAAGVAVHGATVHLVTSELDRGPILLQAVVPVRRDDDAERLAARVLAQEHRIYPLALRWLLGGFVAIEAGQVRIRGEPPRAIFPDRP